jgi:hypothetical protein
VLLNNATTPSAEVDKKAFSFDMIPAGLMDRLIIYKTGAPDLPGEFAGGIIKVFTKNIPEENHLSISYLASHRNGTTFNDFFSGAVSSTDWLGFDDGTRSLPEGFPDDLSAVSNPAEILHWSKSLPNNWYTQKTQAMPDQRLGVTFGRQFRLKKIYLGNITSLSYSNTRESFFSDNLNYNAYDEGSGRSDTIYRYNDFQCNAQGRSSLLHNWSIRLSDHHLIEFRHLLNQSGTNQTTLRSGYNLEEGSHVRNYSFYYQQRTVYSGQLAGQHDLNKGKTLIDWTAGYALTHMREPDYRRIRTKTSSLNNTDKYYLIIAPNASTLDAGRFYSWLNEDMVTLGLNLEQTIRIKPFAQPMKVKSGVHAENKARNFRARWLSYKRFMSSQFDHSLLELPIDQAFTAENMNEKGFKLEEGTNPYDRYTASSQLLATYLGMQWPVTDKWQVASGLRLEKNHMQLQSKRYTGEPVKVDNDLIHLLPSLNLSYHLTSKQIIRVAYARTINRPEFRELAPFSYYDFTFNQVIYGNDSLKTPSIHNYDLRAEWYPNHGELISLGIFYKHFTLPIEKFFVPGTGSGGTRNFTFHNADYSVSLGAEVEIKKSLSGMVASAFLSRFSLYMNAAWIKSRVKLGEKATGQQSQRPMMGQSPFIINTGVYYYQKESSLQVNLLYNVIGKRIYAVGTYGTPDIYELPRHLLDLTIIKGVGKNIELKAGVQDLICQPLILRQDSDENNRINNQDELILERKPGRYVTVGVNVKI